VNYFSYVALAQTHERVAQFEHVMTHMVEKYPPLP
jgi:hypothetical protein